jgi:hypothetical protein
MCIRGVNTTKVYPVCLPEMRLCFRAVRESPRAACSFAILRWFMASVGSRNRARVAAARAALYCPEFPKTAAIFFWVRAESSVTSRAYVSIYVSILLVCVYMYIYMCVCVC